MCVEGGGGRWGELRTHVCVCESRAHACAAVAVGCWGWQGDKGGGPCPGTGVRCTRVCPGGGPEEQHPPVPGSHSSRSSSSLGHSAEATRRSSVFWGGGWRGGHQCVTPMGTAVMLDPPWGHWCL